MSEKKATPARKARARKTASRSATLAGFGEYTRETLWANTEDQRVRQAVGFTTLVLDGQDLGARARAAINLINLLTGEMTDDERNYAGFCAMWYAMSFKEDYAERFKNFANAIRRDLDKTALR